MATTALNATTYSQLRGRHVAREWEDGEGDSVKEGENIPAVRR
jgi:hypothetical protein